MAKYLKGNQFIVGFDPLNEPWPAWQSLVEAINTLIPGHFDVDKLAPMYARIFTEVQKIDPNWIMWFEPAQFPDGFGTGKMPLLSNIGFKVPPGG